MSAPTPMDRPENAPPNRTLSRRAVSLLPWLISVASVLTASGFAYWLLRADNPQPVVKAKVYPPTTFEPAEVPAGMARATFGAGCFWCTEAVFQQLKGVESVVSGYSGGSVQAPTYQQVCAGTTGHAEAVQVTYDPAVISYEELLEVFWRTHDPTTRNRQGNDVGTQYRSVIFYRSEEQKRLAEHYKQKLNKSGLFSAPIVTEIVPFTEFYRAEGYHQNFFAEHEGQPYCRAFIRPKLEKLRELFRDKLSPNAAE